MAMTLSTGLLPNGNEVHDFVRICPSVHLSACPSVCLFVHLFVCALLFELFEAKETIASLISRMRSIGF